MNQIIATDLDIIDLAVIDLVVIVEPIIGPDIIDLVIVNLSNDLVDVNLDAHSHPGAGVVSPGPVLVLRNVCLLPPLFVLMLRR